MTIQQQTWSQENVEQIFERKSPSMVVVVDSDDNEIGLLEKIDAHRKGGTLHRAFSIYLFDDANRLLLQRRAKTKYHFGGLWTNTCCGHAVPSELLSISAPIRLWQEMRICTDIKVVGRFTYSATCPNSYLAEREIDHVYLGTFNGSPSPEPDEVDDWRWESIDDIHHELRENPENFTPWFGLGLSEALKI
jgi:isopentenyl-diphosphate delta-isomerase